MRTLIDTLETSFQAVEKRSLSILRELNDEVLYLRPPWSSEDRPAPSSGELIVRSAAAMEQVFGGITTRLWDDPFEWTLPEELKGCTDVEAYLGECSENRRKAFLFFKDDKELFSRIPAPERLRPVIDVLMEALVRASRLQGRAFASVKATLKCRNTGQP